MIFEVDETQNEKYRPALLNLEMRTGLKGGRLIRYTKDHPTHKNQFRYRVAASGMQSKRMRLVRPCTVKSGYYGKDSYLHDKPQLNQGDFIAPYDQPLSIYNTVSNTFTVKSLRSDVYGGNIMQVEFEVPGIGIRVFSFSHLADKFPEDILSALEKHKGKPQPIQLVCGEVFGWIGYTGNNGIWMQGGQFADPTPHTHIAGLEMNGKELASWCKDVLGIPRKQSVPWKYKW